MPRPNYCCFDIMATLIVSLAISVQLIYYCGVGNRVVPLAVGNIIGVTIWKPTQETEEIVYAAGYNHKRERHLNGDLLETFKRATVLIMYSFNVLTSNALSMQRDVKLIGGHKLPVLVGAHLLA
eukprot:501075_1